MYRHRSSGTDKVARLSSPSTVGTSVLAPNWEVEQSRRRGAEMERQWLDALSASPKPILLVEHDQIVYANRALSAMIGVSEARLLRLKLSRLLTPIDGIVGEDGRDHVDGECILSFEDRVYPVEITSRAVRFNGRLVRQLQLSQPGAFADANACDTSEVLLEGTWQLHLTTPLPVFGLRVEALGGALAASRADSMSPGMQHVLRTALGLNDSTVEACHLLQFLGTGFARELLNAGLNLRRLELRVPGSDAGARHFLISAHAVVWNDHVFRVVGSCLEITEHAEMEQRMVSALEEQREQLGRDLHDGVGQLLTGVQILSGNLARERRISPRETRDQAARIARMAEEAHLNVRQVYRGLSANHLRHLELADALSDLTEFVVTMPEVEGLFQFDGQASVHDLEVKLQLYRIAQEAVNNALKHSRASRMTISWYEEQGYLVLEVCDNGIGFDPNVVSGKTLGLHSMQYRARLIGGRLNLTTRTGVGTTIRCELPKA